MNRPVVGLLGGSGFVGSALANRLVSHGYALRIFTRDRERARHLWPLPGARIVELNPYDQERLTAAVNGCSALVNLIGILNERGDDGAGFRHAHVDIATRVLKACKTARVPRLLHMSALKADPAATSHYLRSKGEAEKLLMAENGRRLRVTIMRPSVIFGPHDRFLNRFAHLIRLSPGVFPLACADARFQPVYVHDVAQAFFAALTAAEAPGGRFDLGGPAVMSLAEIVAYVARTIGRPTRIIRLGPTASALVANICEYLPGKPLSRDNYRSMLEDSVLTHGNGLVQLGVLPTPMHAVAPKYLGGGHLPTRLDVLRDRASRHE
jgi:NADH dehydrogenase